MRSCLEPSRSSRRHLRQEGADVALEDEVRPIGEFDGFGHRRGGSVDQVADLAADGLLPCGQGIDVGVNAWIRGVGHDGSTLAAAVNRAWPVPIVAIIHIRLHI